MYVDGECIGCDEQENFYKNIVVFIIQYIKQSIPIVAKSFPEVTIKSYWLAEEIADSILQFLRVLVSELLYLTISNAMLVLLVS